MVECLVVEKVKEVLDGLRERIVAVVEVGADNSLEHLVYELFQCRLGGQQPGQVDFRHEFVAAFRSAVPTRRVGTVVRPHQMPGLRTVFRVCVTAAAVAVDEGRRAPADPGTGLVGLQ